MSDAVYICRCNTHEINDFIWPFVTVAATEALVGIYLELGQVWSRLFTNVLDYAWKKLCVQTLHTDLQKDMIPHWGPYLV